MNGIELRSDFAEAAQKFAASEKLKRPNKTPKTPSPILSSTWHKNGPKKKDGAGEESAVPPLLGGRDLPEESTPGPARSLPGRDGEGARLRNSFPKIGRAHV